MLVLGINIYVLIALICGLLLIGMFFFGDIGGDMDVDVDMTWAMWNWVMVTSMQV
jgi:hypothetical protein